jgi:hypothetical protein
VYDGAVAVDLKECFINDMERCSQLTLNEYRNRPFAKRCVESLVKLLSPLL